MDEGAAIAVFTGKSLAHIVAEGGSASWVLDRREAQRRRYLVCTRNAGSKEGPNPEPHGSAFLVGRGLGFVSLGERNGFMRWRITFAEYAAVNVPGVWQGWRNPVRYSTLEALGIASERLRFEAVAPTPPPEAAAVAASLPGLSIEEAKAGLAERFGVETGSIDIIIRG